MSIPASWYSRMAACRVSTRALAMTTPGLPDEILDINDRHHLDHRRVRGCHSDRSPDTTAGRPAHVGAGRSSRRSAWTLEIPTSSVPSSCSADRGGQVASGRQPESGEATYPGRYGANLVTTFGR